MKLVKAALPQRWDGGVVIAPVWILTIAVLIVVLESATVARKLSLEPGPTWRFDVTPSTLDRVLAGWVDRVPFLTSHVGGGSVHHVGFLHAVNVSLLVGTVTLVATALRGPFEWLAIGLLSAVLAGLPALEVHEYWPPRAVGLASMTVRIHAFSALYAVVVAMALGVAYSDGVAASVTVGLGVLFSVPFVITQVVVVYLVGDEVTEDLEEGPGPTFLSG